MGEGCFQYTGLEPHINEDIDLDLDDDGRIEAVTGIAIHDPEGRTWLANFEWGDEDEWLVIELDEKVDGMAKNQSPPSPIPVALVAGCGKAPTLWSRRT